MIGTSFLGLLAERGSLKAAIAAIGAAARQVAQLRASLSLSRPKHDQGHQDNGHLAAEKAVLAHLYE